MEQMLLPRKFLFSSDFQLEKSIWKEILQTFLLKPRYCKFPHTHYKQSSKIFQGKLIAFFVLHLTET